MAEGEQKSLGMVIVFRMGSSPSPHTNICSK